MIGGANPNQPVKYGASYKSATALAANTPETIFTAASNVNGAIVWVAALETYTGSGNVFSSIVAKSTAPASIIDGDIVLQGSSQLSISTGHGTAGDLKRPVFVPAGKGLFYISSSLESQSLRSALYTLL